MANPYTDLQSTKESGNNDVIVVVSGLPRSGTSMMMKMLEAGGIEPLSDNIRTSDDDNPKGYYEFERVKRLKTDKEWIPLAKGKAVKVISMLLQELPSTNSYKVIFMHRHMEEILASQQQMLINRNKPADDKSQARMAALYRKHLRGIESWLEGQPNFDVLYLHYHEVLGNPQKYCAMINEFLGKGLDATRAGEIVDKKLYRQQHRPSL